MVQSTKTFRVFVSSTFADLKEERNALQKYVFPKLREFCMENGFRFQAIDLRWGVSEEAGMDQQTMKICLEEIERSQKVSPKPNFIVLLGDRYGWQPLPHEIPADEFEKITKNISYDDLEFVNSWYLCDYNAVPPVYDLQSRNGESQGYDIWVKTEEELRNILLKGAKRAKLPKEQMFKFISSATEQEVIKGALNLSNELPDAKEHVFCFFREINNLNAVKEAALKPPQRIPKQEFNEIIKQTDINSRNILNKCYDLNGDFYIFNNIISMNKDEYKKFECLVLNIIQNAVRISIFDNNNAVNDRIKEKYLSCDLIDINKTNEIFFFDTKSNFKLLELKNRLKKNLPDNIDYYNVEWNNGLQYDHIGSLPEDIINLMENNETIESITLCASVWNRLYKVIKAEIDRKKETNQLYQEINSHYAFGKNRSQFFIGRTEILKDIQNYLESRNRIPLVIYGPSGSGKSALMAEISKMVSEKYAKKSKRGISNFSAFSKRLLKNFKKPKNEIIKDRIIVRFIGATPESTDIKILIEQICKQISYIYNLDESKVPPTYSELLVEFPKLLNFASAEKPLFIFLDAVDQLSSSENAKNLAWLPLKLPEHVHFIISTADTDNYEILKNNIPQTNLLELGSLKDLEVFDLLDTWLKNERRTFTDSQKEEVIKKFQDNRMPLYLKLAFDEAKRWKSYDNVEKTKIGSDISEIFNDLFYRLSLDSNHGKILVSHLVAYLVASRYGLSEDEIIDILSADKEVLDNFRDRSLHYTSESKLPIIIWSRLYFDLEPYLYTANIGSNDLFKFYHKSLELFAKEKYLLKPQKYHQLLADYFEFSEFLNRKMDEFPWHLLKTKSWERLNYFLADDLSILLLSIKSSYDLRMYWSQIEDNSNFKIINAYDKFIQDPENHPYIFELIAQLLSLTGHKKESLELYKKLSKNSDETQESDSPSTKLNEVSVLIDLGQIEEAEDIIAKIENQHSNNKTIKASCYYLRSRIMHDISEPEKGLKYIEKQEKILKEINDKEDLKVCLNWKIALLKQLGRLKEASEISKEVSSLFQQSDNRDGLVSLMFSQSTILYTSGKMNEAIDKIQEAIELAEELGLKEWLGEMYGMKGLFLILDFRTDEALEYFNKSEELCLKMRRPDLLKVTLPYKIDALYRLKKYNEALFASKYSQDIFKEINNSKAFSECLIKHIQILKDIHDGFIEFNNNIEVPTDIVSEINQMKSKYNDITGKNDLRLECLLFRIPVLQEWKKVFDLISVCREAEMLLRESKEQEQLSYVLYVHLITIEDNREEWRRTIPWKDYNELMIEYNELVEEYNSIESNIIKN